MSTTQRPATLSRLKTPRAIMALILREMATTYGRSPGGYIWAIAEPAAGITLLTFIFSFAFVAPPLGTSFALFYATGLVPFFMYVDLNARIAKSIRFSKALLFYPSVTYIDAIVARFLLNLVTQFMVAGIVFSFIFIVLKPQTIMNLSHIFLSISMMAAFAMGVGTFNCFMMTQFPIWERIWGILNRPLFIASCIFFIFDTIPEPYQSILWYNPLIHIIGSMRSGFYPTYAADYVSPLYVFGLSAILIFFGLLLLERYNKEILNR